MFNVNDKVLSHKFKLIKGHSNIKAVQFYNKMYVSFYNKFYQINFWFEDKSYNFVSNFTKVKILHQKVAELNKGFAILGHSLCYSIQSCS